VPEGKTAKNRVHLDIDVVPGISIADERKAAAQAHCELLTARGARFLRELDEPTGWCLVLADPEGNEFCLHSLGRNTGVGDCAGFRVPIAVAARKDF